MKEKKARLKLELIMKVRTGLMTATDAAKELGLSRKMYYQWEKKALSAMMEALTERPAGRKAGKVDSEKENLKKELEAVREEKIRLENTMRIREILSGSLLPWQSSSTGSRTEKKRRREKG